MRGIAGASNGRGLAPVLRRMKDGRWECWRHPGAKVERCLVCYTYECVRCRDLHCHCCGRAFAAMRARRYLNPDLLHRVQGYIERAWRRRRAG